MILLIIKAIDQTAWPGDGPLVRLVSSSRIEDISLEGAGSIQTSTLLEILQCGCKQCANHDSASGNSNAESELDGSMSCNTASLF